MIFPFSQNPINVWRSLIENQLNAGVDVSPFYTYFMLKMSQLS